MRHRQDERFWGAYANKPDDANTGRYDPDARSSSSSAAACTGAVPRADNIIYACDRINDRVQSFHPDGHVIKEVRFRRKRSGDGTAWDIAFSKDAAQKVHVSGRRPRREGLVLDAA